MQNAFSEIKHSQNSYFTLTAQRSEKDTKNSNFAQNEKKKRDSIYDKSSIYCTNKFINNLSRKYYISIHMSSSYFLS